MSPTPVPATPTPDDTPDPGNGTATPSPTATIGVSPEPLRELEMERVFGWFDEDDPTYLTEVPDDSGRLAVLIQDGLMFLLEGGPENAEGSTLEVLDISHKVSRQGNEEGLLGLAFHPQFQENQRFYLYYSASGPRRSVISEFTFNESGAADPDSERVIMEVEQPYPNHNGGMIKFGPDGYFYIALGDGGSGGDPQGNGQDPSTLLGSILRIDVDSSTDDMQYGIPADNPFVEGGGAPEVWAYGLRNPWRFSFDPETGYMWAADVGQGEFEEVNIVRRGENYGWNAMEADSCFDPPTDCDPTGLEPPVTFYDHSQGCSVTGGYVYRGNRLPTLSGAYVYGDYCSGRIWALRHNGEDVTEHIVLADTDMRITSFGVDVTGDLYVLDRNGGVYRFTEP
ncbi:MAG: PQQ-dependent sugar dehydrogenase [Dehalococcoidia bacterium]